MEKNKKIKVILLLIFICISIIVEMLFYGNEQIFIADYMPTIDINGTPTQHKEPEKTFVLVMMSRIKNDIIPIFLGMLVLTVICTFGLFKKGILKRDKSSIIYIIILLVIPILIASIKLLTQYGYTS